MTTPIVAITGSSSDPAVTGPAAFAAVQEHNRPDTINKQAAEIKDLKRKVQELLNDRIDMVEQMIELKSDMVEQHNHVQSELDRMSTPDGYDETGNPRGNQALRNIIGNGSTALEEKITDIIPPEWREEEESEDDQ